MNFLKFTLILFGIALLGVYFDVAINYNPPTFINVLFAIGNGVLSAGLSIERKL